MYVSLRTVNYYWDGIGISRAIENADSMPLLHQNHLLYAPMGHAAWSVASGVLPDVRALDVLQILSAVLGAAAVAMFYLALLARFRSRYIAACLSLAMAFSATWWKFSTDANSYVPSTFFVVVALWLTSPGRVPRPFLLGCVHAFGMLLHQLAALFMPALLIALWYQQSGQPARRRLACMLGYSSVAAVITISVYAAAFAAERGTLDVAALMQWVASYSEFHVSLSPDIGQNIATSIGGNMKLVMGGRLPLVRAVWNPFLMLTSAIAIALSVALLFALRRGGKLGLRILYPDIARMSLVWIGVYLAFLLFWLPQNTFYRMFYLPGLLMLLGSFGAVPGTAQRQYRLALAVGVLFFWNLGFHIYPYAQPAANGTLQIAQAMQSVWPAGTVVYWDVYTADNRTIQYFNPQVKWRPLWGRAWVGDVQETMDAAYGGGQSLWFDLGALESYGARDAEFRNWLAANTRLGPKHEFTNGDHTTGFVQVLPR
jgi:hypothetical protein